MLGWTFLFCKVWFLKHPSVYTYMQNGGNKKKELTFFLEWVLRGTRWLRGDCWSVFCQASVQKFPRGHIVYWNYISISKHNTWWMVMVLSERGWCCQFWCKGISVPNFPVVILCIGIILVFQNIIHGGWWWCCRRGGDTDGIWYKRIYVPNFIT